jgi:hypothetical protein
MGIEMDVARETCPHCHDGRNSVERGGSNNCFHCDLCDYFGCMWTADEKLRMLSALALNRPGASKTVFIVTVSGEPVEVATETLLSVADGFRCPRS